MKNKLEYILLSVLLGISVLLGLSFWLNTIFNFNIFCATHWDEFAKLQASKIPISSGFYASFVIAILIFVIGLYFIYRSTLKHPVKEQAEIKPAQIPEQKTPDPTQIKEIEKNSPVVQYDRPPRLNLPKNMAEIASQNHINRVNQEQSKALQSGESPYNSIISEIFSTNGYLVKSNPRISGFTPNLFAIGNNEILWIGGVDCNIEKMMNTIQKLDSVFKETLEDIQININAFILDTQNRYDSQNGAMMVFKSVDELKDFINAHPADNIDDTEQESFDSYSEYIDTIIQYIKNV